MGALPAVTIVVFLEVVCLGATFPVLNDYCLKLGCQPEHLGVVAGLMFALVAGPKVLTNALWGSCSDRWGRKKTLAVVSVGTMAGSVLWALAPGLAVLAISRGIGGIFSAQGALAYAVASDVSRPEKRAASMGVLGAAFGVGLVVGIALGGMVGYQLSIAAVGWFCAACQFVSLGVIIFVLPETAPPHPFGLGTSDSPGRQPLWRLAARLDIAWLLVICMLLTGGLAVLIPTLREILRDWYDFQTHQVTLAFVVWAAVGLVVQGGLIRPIVKRLGESATMVLGAAILAGGFALLAARPGHGGFWCAMVLIAIGGGLAVPALVSLMSLRVSEADQGAIHGLNQSITALGRAAGYLMGGSLYVGFGPAWPYGIGAALVLMAAAMLITRPPTASRTG